MTEDVEAEGCRKEASDVSVSSFGKQPDGELRSSRIVPCITLAKHGRKSMGEDYHGTRDCEGPSGIRKRGQSFSPLS